MELGKGALADKGERVVVHYEARWRGVTFMTSRTQWGGVTGGQPLGFDVGATGAGGTLPGLDLVSSFTAPLACAPPGGSSSSLARRAGCARHARRGTAQAAGASPARIRLARLWCEPDWHPPCC